MSTTPPITKGDIEAKLRRLQGDVESKVESKRATVLKVGVAAGAVLLVVVFLLGTRKGARKTTIVEIRRV